MSCLEEKMENKYEVEFTALAVYDLKRIEIHLDGYDPSIFIYLMSKLKERILLLEEQPYVFVVFLSIDKVCYRRFVIKGYVVVYDIDEISNKVYIDRIFHHSEDYYQKRLNEKVNSSLHD